MRRNGRRAERWRQASIRRRPFVNKMTADPGSVAGQPANRPGHPTAAAPRTNPPDKEIAMGKLVVSEFITLDGIIENPGGSEDTKDGGWSFRHPAPDGQQAKFDELRAADVQLLGRGEPLVGHAAWPAMEESTGEFGKK